MSSTKDNFEKHLIKQRVPSDHALHVAEVWAAWMEFVNAKRALELRGFTIQQEGNHFFLYKGKTMIAHWDKEDAGTIPPPHA